MVRCHLGALPPAVTLVPRSSACRGVAAQVKGGGGRVWRDRNNTRGESESRALAARS